MEMNKECKSMNTVSSHGVHTTVCENGLTIIVRQTTHVPQVSVRMGIRVGSAHEQEGEKGLAHLLEHMVFKGTDILSESDIAATATKLSASINAYTTWDSTTYIFNLPTRHWYESLPILASCLKDCTFKQDLLNAEFKAVIQELKMRRDNYELTLYEEMMGVLFNGHPYHYPIIGYKQDIWNVTSEDLHRFYKKHYMPNNAVLVIVGDVDPQDALEKARKAFAHIPAGIVPTKGETYYKPDIRSKNVTLYRDIQQPVLHCMYVVPGLNAHNTHTLNALAALLGSNASSRLYKRLRDKEELVHTISSSVHQLFEHGILSIYCTPKELSALDTIISCIHEEIAHLKEQGPDPLELIKVMQTARVEHYKLLESNSNQADQLTQMYLATGDSAYIYTSFNDSQENGVHLFQEMITEYLRPALMNRGVLAPLHADDKPLWLALQKASDEEDAAILEHRMRKSSIEQARYVHTVNMRSLENPAYPKPQQYTLMNGITVLLSENTNVPMVTVALLLKADLRHDSPTLPGLYHFMTAMLMKGTMQHDHEHLASELSQQGAAVHISVGGASLISLKDTLAKSLALFTEMLIHPRFDEEQISLQRQSIIATINRLSDMPDYKVYETAQRTLYAGHPQGKSFIGTIESVNAIMRDDLRAFHQEVISPHEVTVAVVGDFTDIDIIALLNSTLGMWQGKPVETIEYPLLLPVPHEEINITMNRDQVHLAWAGLSVKRLDPDFDALAIFGAILSNGMNSKLFKLRKQTGLFYTIYGTMLMDAGEYPGMIFVQTIVSPDQLAQAVEVITHMFDTVIDTIIDDEVEEAKRCILDNIVNYYAQNGAIANTLLSLHKYHLPFDYYDQHASRLQRLDTHTIKETARRWFKREALMTIKVGRV